MKTTIQLLFIFCALLSPRFSVGQSTNEKGYSLRYEYVNNGLRDRHDVILAVLGPESLTTIKNGQPLDSKGKDLDFSVSGEDSVGLLVYRNSKTGETVFRDFYSVGGAMEPCVVKDPVPQLAWTYEPKSKKIGGYNCKFARVTFRGRTYEAWYTDELPITHGLWKFNGLPGALVEIQSTDRVILFRLVSVERGLKTPIAAPTGGQRLTMQEFVKYKASSTEDFVNALKAKLPRGAEVTVSTKGDYNIETDFSDVKK